MKNLLLLLIIIFLGCSAPKSTTERTEDISPLTKILDMSKEFSDALDPSQDSVYNRLPNRTPAMFEERYNSIKKFSRN